MTYFERLDAAIVTSAGFGVSAFAGSSGPEGPGNVRAPNRTILTGESPKVDFSSWSDAIKTIVALYQEKACEAIL
jgi:hypothetical protein